MGGEELVGQNLGGTLGFSSLPVLVMCPGVFGCFGVLALALPSGELWFPQPCGILEVFRNRLRRFPQPISEAGCDRGHAHQG